MYGYVELVGAIALLCWGAYALLSGPQATLSDYGLLVASASLFAGVAARRWLEGAARERVSMAATGVALLAFLLVTAR